MDIKEFINDKFGSVRVIDNDGSEWFVGVDVARCLGYAIPKNAVRDHVKKKHKKELKLEVLNSGTSSSPSHGGLRRAMVIDFPGLCKLVMHSKLPDAEEFQDWICEEVLPSIRETGAYLDVDNPKVRSATIEFRTTLTEVFYNLASLCYWITPEQAQQTMRTLTRISNNMAGIYNGGRDEANTEQLLKLSVIESSFVKTISKKMRKFRADNQKFSFSNLIYNCEAKAVKALNKAGYKTDKVYITTNW